MQRASCDRVELLISKYVDGEAISSEREEVEIHTAECERCARKLTEHMEIAAIFSEERPRTADSSLGAGLFAQIERMKDEERRRALVASAIARQQDERARRERSTSQATGTRTRAAFAFGGFGSRIWKVASPLALAGLAVVTLVVMTLASPSVTNVEPQQAITVSDTLLPPVGVPTRAATTVSILWGGDSDVPGPVATGQVMPVPASSESATVRATATFAGDVLVHLAEPTAVLESAPQQSSSASAWHVLRDPQFGYTISYPPNWWTQAHDSSRTFYPWGPGGTAYAPYWIDVRVQSNTRSLSAETANQVMFGGKCEMIGGANGEPKCLRHTSGDAKNVYDEIYAFDATHIYILRASVPRQSTLGDFSTRWEAAQQVFSHMSGSISLAPSPTSAGGYAPALFLNGSDLWVADAASGGARPVTHGYGVHSFALSPNLRDVAFTASNSAYDPLAQPGYLYLASVGPTSGASAATDTSTPLLIWSRTPPGQLKIYDLAWYSDHEILAIADSDNAGFGVYKLTLQPASTGAAGRATPALLLKLGSDMIGARGLAVAPDRQLISFLAPLGENKGTDIYVFRPDGSDLRRVVSHTDPSAPYAGEKQLLSPDQQAVKSYVWTDGRLEFGGYQFDMLLTCGNYESPTLYRGGFLYSAPRGLRAPILDPSALSVDDPYQVQIVHLAYSPQGKVAFTGFYTLRDYRAEELAGLWIADVTGGVLSNIKPLPVPASPHGIADLQWSPDGKSLIYRETIPQDEASFVSRYDGNSAFLMVKLDPASGKTAVLYDGSHR